MTDQGRRYLLFLGKAFLVSSAILLSVDFFLQPLAVLFALCVGLYLFFATYTYMVLKPMVLQDVLFWLLYVALVALTTVAHLGLCAVAPNISPICQRYDQWWLFLRGFPAVVMVIFWMIVRTLHMVRQLRAR